MRRQDGVASGSRVGHYDGNYFLLYNLQHRSEPISSGESVLKAYIQLAIKWELMSIGSRSRAISYDGVACILIRVPLAGMSKKQR
jgi:hypothetical protein